MDSPTVTHAFLSYVHEDKGAVDRLHRMLEAAGIPVWRDTRNLWPGEEWKLKIREAIADDALVFLACFSTTSVSKEKSYQNEELLLAVEQMRLRPPGRVWLIPVRLDDCTLPEFDLGGGRTLANLNWIDLFPEPAALETSAPRLISSIYKLLPTPATGTLAIAHAREPATDGSITATIKRMLPDATKQIELEDLLAGLTRDLRDALQDEQRYPVTRADVPGSDQDLVRLAVRRAREYADLVRPLSEALVAGAVWGSAEQAPVWSRAMQDLAGSCSPGGSGLTLLVELRQFPVLPALYAASMAAIARGRFDSLAAVAVEATRRLPEGARVPLVATAHPYLPFRQFEVVAQALALDVDGIEVTDEVILELNSGRRGKRFTPVSDTLFTMITPLLNDLVPDPLDLEEIFDRTEILLALLATDAKHQLAGKNVYVHGAWTGSNTWRHRYFQRGPEQQLHEEFLEASQGWAPLRAGLFGGQVERADGAFAAYLELSRHARANRF